MQSDWLKDIPCEGGGEEESGGEGDAGVDGDAEGEDDTENGDESTSVVVIDVGIPSPPPGSSELDGSDTLSTSPEPSLPEVISSESTSEDSDDDDDDDDDDVVCIDAAALDHVARQDLVFSNHVLKAVLCDMYGSCATDGHIVEYRGHAMMMRTYCDLVGCSKREVEVNSPRYRRRLRVPSRTEGLEFTSLAARYSTRVEERMLAIVVHIGL
ncbi:unnamed protein product [Chondrus crispus]|uniref:Uncharacterized protein n=1 Tax=Chondrus crispus TaxID=2769 RepID=R7QLS2_CHOCR|nr:unnamed protein product [Chondrus crispus]CDF39024.1 unnamed protein product [Chondrus crispus]|eukprot:XP_005718929.1 unnamed protein product [Chondrus crispus]